MRTALGGEVRCLLAAHVADVRTAVVDGVSVHDFLVEAGIGDAEAIAAADDGGGVDDGDDKIFGFFAAADEGENTVVRIVGVNPFETVPIKFDLMEGGLGGIEMIEVNDELLDAAMGIVLEQVPVQAVRFGPFAALGEFLAHEEELLAGMRVLIGVEKTEIGELLPHVAGHFMEKRIFSVDDFIVREGKLEIFGEGVEKRKG
jgi:hypothetical protein